MCNIAIVGRTNVGKSTLFNKLVEKNQALISAQPNTTRDRNYGEIVWRGETINLIDTGGIDTFNFLNNKTEKNTIEKQILQQTNKAIAEANLILFVVDGRDGILPQEKALVKILKKTHKQIILTCNKIDGDKIEQNIDINEFIKIDCGNPFYISAKNGRGVGDLLDKAFFMLKTVKKKISRKAKAAKRIKPIKIALIGKPNVGKSSLLNTLLDKKHAIVSPIEHTTREPQDITFTYKKQPFTIIDTVGIRRKSNIKKNTERFGVKRSLESLKRADIAALIVDVGKNLSTQDNYLADRVRKNGCALIIVVNKWDLVENKKTNTINQYTDYFYRRFPYLWWSPIVFTSALTKIRVKNILELALKINQEKNKIIPDAELKIFTKKFIEHHKPVRGKNAVMPGIKNFFQASTNPPTFILQLYSKTDLRRSYLKYIENRLRRTFGFNGVPIQIAINQPRVKHRQTKI